VLVVDVVPVVSVPVVLIVSVDVVAFSPRQAAGSAMAKNSRFI